METGLIDLRAAGAPTRAAVLRLNAAHAAQTSPLDAPRLDALLSAACAAPGRADGGAFLIALDRGADHDSPNFLWLRARLPGFVYVDRLVVAPGLRRRGLGRALYAEVFARAAARGLPVACEVNAVPPNPVSDAFHAALGFAEIGRGAPAPGKEVRYLLCDAPGRGPRPPR